MAFSCDRNNNIMAKRIEALPQGQEAGGMVRLIPPPDIPLLIIGFQSILFKFRFFRVSHVFRVVWRVEIMYHV